MARICILTSVHRALDSRIFYREARSLQRIGHEIILIAQHDRPEIRDGITIVPLSRVARWKRPLLWAKIARLAPRTKADAYQFHDPELLLVAPWLRLATGKPIVYDVLESHPDFIRIKAYLPRWLREPLAQIFAMAEPLLARLQSGLIFADDQIAASFAGLRLPKATLFNYPERAFVQQALADTRGLSQRGPVVLHLGTHERSRGALLMVDAFAQVVRACPDAKLLLVGPFFPADLEREVRERIARLGIQHAVAVTGQVPFEQIGQYLRQAMVGWFAAQPVPKYQKNIPSKIFEYMAYGLAVVSSDLLPVRPFLLEGGTGLLARADDPSAHADAILELLLNPDMAAAMGKRGQELVAQQYNWDEMEKRLQRFYEGVLGTGLETR